MKAGSVVVLGLVCILAGCSHQRTDTTSSYLETVPAQLTDSETLLVCLQKTKQYTRSEYREIYKKASASESFTKNDMYRICLNLHRYSEYKNFKDGLESLQDHVKISPADSLYLQGIASLVERIDKEKIKRWSQRNKLMNEREALEEENAEMAAALSALEQENSQNQKRVEELQKQIEQLKNIENIIKNRELQQQ